MRWHVQVQIRYGGSSVKKKSASHLHLDWFFTWEPFPKYSGVISISMGSGLVMFSCYPPTLVESTLIPKTLAV